MTNLPLVERHQTTHVGDTVHHENPQVTAPSTRPAQDNDRVDLSPPSLWSVPAPRFEKGILLERPDDSGGDQQVA